MASNAAGKQAMAEVTLRPRVTFLGEKRPTEAEHKSMHHEAHEQCFLANSVKTDVWCDALDVTNGEAQV
jgi:organic hydroperoxide reductase OsmC/OhrA